MKTLDVSLSWPIFCLRLGVLEWPLSVPGVWFGIPITSLVFMPMLLVLADMDPQRHRYACTFLWTMLVCVPTFIVLLVRWVRVLLAGDHHPMYSTKLVPPLVLALLGSLQFFHWFDHMTTHGSAVPYFYISSWFLTQTVVSALKICVGRMRPGIALAESLRQVPRHLACLNYRGSKGVTVFESFPSGDAAGAMAFSTALFVITGRQHLSAFVFAGLSAFGRMYFWAHHIGDVSAGMAIAYVCTEALDRMVGWRDFGAPLTLTITGVSYYVIFKLLPKLRVPLPAKYRTPSD